MSQNSHMTSHYLQINSPTLWVSLERCLATIFDLKPLTIIQLRQAETDHRAAEPQERLVHRGQLLPAAAQAAELVQPTDRPLNHPSELAQAAAVARVPPRDHRL